MNEPPLIPAYQKPDTPGVWMNFDNPVSLYHVVESSDDFEKAVGDLFGLLKESQERFPNWPRTFYLDIRGHLDKHGEFEPDFFELQQEFFFSVIAPFVTAFDLPLTGPLVNPEPQRNDGPDRLVIGPPVAGNPNPASGKAS